MKVDLEKGISLVEVLVGLVLGMLLAGTAIPKLFNSKILANEASAIGNLDLITIAQDAYKTAYPELGYADSLSRLASLCFEPECTPTPEHACLIDCTLPRAAATKDGYYYNLSSPHARGRTFLH